MSETSEDQQKNAKTKLSECGKELCEKYVFGWGGPIDWAEEMFPYIKSGIADIKTAIPSDLPICVFQTRDLRPNHMIAVVPFKTPDGNPTNTRVLPAGDISQNTLITVTEFSQAFLSLLHTGAIPSIHEGEKLVTALISLTDKRLFVT